MNTPAYPNVTTSQSLYGWTQIIYVLHAVSLVTGILGVVTIVGMFLTGWPSIIAVIMNYIKRSEARGTWLESHFRWQLRTFWSGVIWVLLVGFLTVGIGLLVLWLPLGVWFIYRIARGWMALSAHRPMYA